MDSLRAAVAVPIQVDDQDILNLEDKSGNVPSPTKRSRWDEKAGSSSAGISLADLTAALSPLTQGVLEVKQRVTDIEHQFATKVNKTLDLIQSLNDKQRDQGDKLQKIQEAMEAQKEQDRKQDSAIQDILRHERGSLEAATLRGRAGRGATHTRLGHGRMEPGPGRGGSQRQGGETREGPEPGH